MSYLNTKLIEIKLWFQHKKFKNIIRYSYIVFRCDYDYKKNNLIRIKSQVTRGLDHIIQLPPL